MNMYYKLDNGCHLEIFLWSDVAEGETFRKTIEVTPFYGKTQGRSCKKELFKDDHGVYIIWNSKKIYLNEYSYYGVNELISEIEKSKIENSTHYVSNDEILATFIKCHNEIGVVLDMPAFDFIFPSFGFGSVGNKEYTVLCVPTEKHYKTTNWFYKFSLECECEELRKYIPYRDFYFSDFCSLVRQGIITIVEKDKFKKEIIEKHRIQTLDQNRLRNRIARLFGKEKTYEKLPLIHP